MFVFEGGFMIYVNCPKCGKRLMEGEVGSTVKIKCGNCDKLYIARILPEEVIIKPKDKFAADDVASQN